MFAEEFSLEFGGKDPFKEWTNENVPLEASSLDDGPSLMDLNVRVLKKFKLEDPVRFAKLAASVLTNGHHLLSMLHDNCFRVRFQVETFKFKNCFSVQTVYTLQTDRRT